MTKCRCLTIVYLWVIMGPIETKEKYQIFRWCGTLNSGIIVCQFILKLTSTRMKLVVPASSVLWIGTGSQSVLGGACPRLSLIIRYFDI